MHADSPRVNGVVKLADFHHSLYLRVCMCVGVIKSLGSSTAPSGASDGVSAPEGIYAELPDMSLFEEST